MQLTSILLVIACHSVVHKCVQHMFRATDLELYHAQFTIELVADQLSCWWYSPMLAEGSM